MSDYIFMAAHSRIGTYKVVGPVTGRQYHIPIAGTWVDEEDGEILRETTIMIFCHRQGRDIEIYPVYEIPSLTQDQLASKPSANTTTLERITN